MDPSPTRRFSADATHREIGNRHYQRSVFVSGSLNPSPSTVIPILTLLPKPPVEDLHKARQIRLCDAAQLPGGDFNI